MLRRVRRRRTLKYEFTYWHGACMNLRKRRKNLTDLIKTNTWKSEMYLLWVIVVVRLMVDRRKYYPHP